jgi:hypothetical protein
MRKSSIFAALAATLGVAPGLLAVREHVSEAMAGLLIADRVIHNTGTLEDLTATVRDVLWERRA